MMETKLRSRIKLLALGIFAFSQSYSQTTTFTYTGGTQTYTVPVGVTSITVDVYGAQGGFGYNVPNVGAGLGGRLQATVAVTPGEVLNIYVGGQGGPGGTTIGGTAGYNGGGVGGGWPGGRSGGGGGGGSDIRRGGTALANRILVAAGGGGTGVNYSTGNRGGDGGGLTGANGLTGTYLGAGATQVAGGAPNGVLGGGGNAPGGQTGGGGGGGYYGGGSSAWEGGGGGSSWTSSVGITSVVHTAGSRNGNGQIAITAIVPLSTTVTQSATIQCFGQSTGALTANPTGGTSPYTYSWAPSGGNAATATGLAAGTYTVTVTDGASAITTQTFTLTQPTAVVASASSTNVLCNAGNSGTATATVSGGTPGYTYLWSNGGTTATITNLTAGVYTYTVTDTEGCSAIQTTTVTEPSALAATTMQTNVSCYGGGNGDAMVMATGGTPNYTYSWAPIGGNADLATGLLAGTYTCTITDANGCLMTQTVSITEPSAMATTATSSAILCNGDSATITVATTGGTAPYTGVGTFSVLAGPYTYVITDANGCVDSTSITVTEPSAFAISIVQIDATCNGNSDGSIYLTVTGGTGPYTYNWNNNQFTTEDLTGLPAGSYFGILTDANGCQDSGTVVIGQPAVLSAAVTSSSNPTTCGGSNGAIDITTSGGTPNYTYQWSNNATTEDVSGLSAGVYTCVVLDSLGCGTQLAVTLSDPAAPVVTVSLNNDTVCNLDGAFVLTGGSPSGGTYSGPGVSAGSFNPTTANAGANTITYTYTDSQTGCTASNTDIIFVDPCAGVAENTFVNSFNVYPNPNNGTFTLQLNTTAMADVLIYDALGKLFSTMKIQPNMQQQVSIETNGVYLITVVTADGNRSSQRVVVNK
jgi:hypothetical protein